MNYVTSLHFFIRKILKSLYFHVILPREIWFVNILADYKLVSNGIFAYIYLKKTQNLESLCPFFIDFAINRRKLRDFHFIAVKILVRFISSNTHEKAQKKYLFVCRFLSQRSQNSGQKKIKKGGNRGKVAIL